MSIYRGVSECIDVGMGTIFDTTSNNTSKDLWKISRVSILIPAEKRKSDHLRRCIDDIFMATNEIIDEINIELVKLKRKDINLGIDANIDSSVQFLDVTITN